MISNKELIIKNAINEYNNSKTEKDILNSINMMENVFIMCSKFNVKGLAELQQTITKAKNDLIESEDLDLCEDYKQEESKKGYYIIIE